MRKLISMGVLLFLGLSAALAAAVKQVPGKAAQAAKERHEDNLYNSALIDLNVILTDLRGHDNVVTVPARRVVVVRDAVKATICSDKDNCTTTDIKYGKEYAIVADVQRQVWVIVESSQ